MTGMHTLTHARMYARTRAYLRTRTQLLEEKTAAEKELKAQLDAATKEAAARQSELASVKEEMQAQIHEHEQDLFKAQAALEAATSAARVDVRAKGGGVVLDEMARERRRVARALSAVAAQALDARSLEDVIASVCPLVRQMLAAQACAIYLLLIPAETPVDSVADEDGGGGGKRGGGGGGGSADATPVSGGAEKRGKRGQVLRALVSGRAVEQYAANMMEAFLPPPEGMNRKESEMSGGSVTWEREELTHVMDLDVDPSRGLLAAALKADPDAPEGAAIVCAAAQEDARFDAAVDGAYFQHWVVGEDKQLGASISVAVRHPNSQVVGVMQVCRSKGEEAFEAVDVELVSEAARLVGMRHASLMLEHSSFVDALDQASRPIARALGAGDDMLHQLGYLQGLISDMARQAAHADTSNAHLASPAASPSDAALPQTAARPAAPAASASSAAHAQPFAPAGGGGRGLGAGARAAETGAGSAGSPQSPAAEGRGVARKLAVDHAHLPFGASGGAGPHVSDAGARGGPGGGAVMSSGASAAGSVGSSSSSSNGVVAAHRDRFEREAAAALAANAHAAPAKGAAARTSPSPSPALAPGAGPVGGSSGGGAHGGKKGLEGVRSSGVKGGANNSDSEKDVQKEVAGAHAGGRSGGVGGKQAGNDTSSDTAFQDVPSPQGGPLVVPGEELPEMDEVFEVVRMARSLYDYDAVEPDELSIC